MVYTDPRLAAWPVEKNLIDTCGIREDGRSPAGLDDVFVKNGATVPAVLDRTLKLGKALMVAVFFAALSPPSVPAAAGATENARAAVLISAVVPIRTELKVLKQQRDFVITDNDIRRGFMQIDGATILEVKNNTPRGCMLEFAARGVKLREASVNVMGRDIVLGSEGGLIMLPVEGRSIVALGYRFVFAPDTEPGTYEWPLTFEMSPL